ncbi:MAG: GntR family transcriptional regulator [Betaproteobacteria bacterium]
MFFDTNPSACVPIYSQIIEPVRRRVSGGRIKPGDDPPSVRTAAVQHALNPMTVSKAYSLLEAEGLATRQSATQQHPASPWTGRRMLVRSKMIQNQEPSPVGTGH